MMRMYGRRRQLSAEETAANAQARAAREAAGMHCQCCGKLFLANTGLMAHHGYQRPGGGWQTASCMGARYLPFEVSRERLAELIHSLISWRTRAIVARSAVEAETQAISLQFSDYSQRRDAYGRRPQKMVEVTRVTFEAVRTENQAAFRQHCGWESFDAIKETDLRFRAREIENVTDEIKAQNSRFDGWKQTHEWSSSSKTWKEV